MVARRFVVRQGPAAGGSGKGEAEAEEHEVEYDTDHGIDVLRFQIFSLTSVPPDLQKVRPRSPESQFPPSPTA
jgi:peptide-N4-(N-acetyl-beta-glucosaminyl)asparagine amidase